LAGQCEPHHTWLKADNSDQTRQPTQRLGALAGNTARQEEAVAHHRAGELTAVWVPDVGHEAMRDLVRARLDAVHALRPARQQLSGFLFRQGCHYTRQAWTKLHRRWLAGLKFEQAVHYLVLGDHIAAVEPPKRGAIG
jgi:transposase